MVNCLTKSRECIDILNRLGLCSSYDTMKRDDMEIATWIIESTGGSRCPVNSCIQSGYPIRFALDNFNHKERTE